MIEAEPTAALRAAVPDDVLTICRRLREKGKRSWVVGGCVRDVLRGVPAKDWDIATDARPEEVKRAFSRVVPTGIQHGTVTVVLGHEPYEVTTLRGEGAYHDGRRPTEVVFLDDIVEDLARRDFTMNAIAFDPLDGHLVDPFNGQGDLHRRVLRAVGEPLARFTEDGLRILRGARFAALLGCEVEPGTRAAMGHERALSTFRQVSVERVHDEWHKTMLATRPSVGFQIMADAGMLAVHCPELVESIGCEQNRWHAYDVWNHTLACVDACEPDPVLRIAALLHDVAKPRTRARSDKTQDFTFFNHEIVGADMAAAIARRLKFSGEETKRIVSLVRHHLICYAPSWSDAGVRRWLRRVTPELAGDLYRLGRADAAAKGRDFQRDLDGIEELRARVAHVLEAGQALSARELAIDGNDLMRELSLPPGRVIGELLTALLEVVTDEPEANERERLLDHARAWLARDGSRP